MVSKNRPSKIQRQQRGCGSMSQFQYSFFQTLREKIFFLLWNSDPHILLHFLDGTLENLAVQSKTKMQKLFLDIETGINFRLGSILKKLTQSHNRQKQVRRFYLNQNDCKNKNYASTELLQIQKNQLNDLRQHMGRHCKVLFEFDFNSAKYDLSLIKSYLLPILVNEQDIESTVNKKTNQFISFKIVDFQLLDKMNFLGGTTRLYSFLKAFKTSKTEKFFPNKWCDNPDKKLPPFDALYRNIRRCNPLEAE